MPFTFIASAFGVAGGSGTTLDTSTSLNLAAGKTIIVTLTGDTFIAN